MNFLLKIISGQDAGKEYPLQEGENLVGRSRAAHVRVYNEDVSGKHFIVDVSKGVICLHNLSHYGTRLDGVLVQKVADLHPGQILEAGKSLKLVVEQQIDAGANYPGTSGSIEETGITRLIGDVPDQEPLRDETRDFPGDETGITRLIGDVSRRYDEDEDDPDDETGTTSFLADVPRNANDRRSDSENIVNEETSPPTSGSVPDEASETAGISKEHGANDTLAETSFTVMQQPLTEESGSDFTSEETVNATASDVLNHDAGNSDAPSRDLNQASYEEEEQGAFFADDLDDSEKTSANETQIVQTRMANMEEINFIKTQIKKQRQSRLFFKLLLFASLFVLLGIIWILKGPQQEKLLSWPQKREKGETTYPTGYLAPFGKGYKDGGFDLYYPMLEHTKIENSSPDTVTVSTFIGKKEDVPLSIILQREESGEFVYENRSGALRNAMRRLSEQKEALLNFDTPNKSFLVPARGPAQNGILCDTVAYQVDTTNSKFGILRFFREGKFNYILRVEVPAEEKLRAASILAGYTFLDISPAFVSSHWEGDDEYTKGDPERIMLGIRDELFNRNSPMQYSRLERLIKSILAQTMYNGQKELFSEAMELLSALRNKQQLWYNGQRIRWFAARGDSSEKIKIRNESEAVFSMDGDKRRYDILRDYWE